MRLRGYIAATVCVLLTATALLFFYARRVPQRLPLFVATPAPQVELIPVYLGVALGYFEASGLPVQIVNTLSELGQKEPALCACRLEEIIYGCSLEAKRRVATAVLTEKESALLLSRQPESFSWDKTKQKSIISNGPANSTTVILEEILRKNKIPPHREVTIMQNIPEELRIPAFLAGTGDYIIVPEPTATSLIKQNRAFFAAPLYTEGPLPLVVLAAGEEWTAQNKKTIETFNRALGRARGYLYSRSPQEIACIVGPYFPHVSLSTLETAVTRCQKDRIWSPTGTSDQVSFDRLQEILKRAGELPRPVPYHEVFMSQK